MTLDSRKQNLASLAFSPGAYVRSAFIVDNVFLTSTVLFQAIIILAT